MTNLTHLSLDNVFCQAFVVEKKDGTAVFCVTSNGEPYGEIACDTPEEARRLLADFEALSLEMGGRRLGPMQ